MMTAVILSTTSTIILAVITNVHSRDMHLLVDMDGRSADMRSLSRDREFSNETESLSGVRKSDYAHGKTSRDAET